MTVPIRSTTAAADARIPSRHPLRAHLDRAAELRRTDGHSLWAPDDGPCRACT